MPLFDDTRAAWGAAQPASWLGRADMRAPLTTRIGLTWHYDGGTPLSAALHQHSACLAKVRADQRLHMGPGREWGDIGYQALICPHGRAIEGRSLNTAGAHCPGLNHTHIGVQIMVGGSETPTAAAYARADRFATEASRAAGRRLRENVHSDGYATSCPGPKVKAWQRARVGRLGSVGTGGSTPIGAGGSGGSTVKDWFDMASDADLERIVRKVILDPATLKEIARYVSTGYPIGPDGDQQVLGGWAYLAAHAAKAALEAIGQESDSAQVKAAVEEALAGYSLTLSKNGAQQ